MADLHIHANLAIATGAVFIPVCSCCVGLRVYARRLHRVSLGADDWTVMIALLFVIAMGVTLIAGEPDESTESRLINLALEVGLKKLGYAAPDPSTAVGKPNTNIALWPVEILQVPALGLMKSSFVFLYRRILTKSAAPKFNLITWGMLLIVLVWTISFFFSIVFICGSNFSAYWTSMTVESMECVKTSILHSAFAISDVVTDVIIIAMPLPIIWRLHLTTRRKLGICAIFSLGAFTIAASTVRMAIFIRATAANYDPNADFEFLCTSGVYWSMIESGLGLCAACLPVHYGLHKSKTLQSIIRSVQSAISLRSLSPRGSAHDQTKLSPQASEVHIATSAAGPARDGHSLEMGPMPKGNEILVTHRLDHDSREIGRGE